MKVMEKKITFGIIVGTRGFFNPELAKQGRLDLLAQLDKLGYDYVIPPMDATPNGAIETLDDARTCAALFKEKADVIDGIIVTLPNFGDEQGVVTTLELSRLDVPVLVHAFDDDLDKLDVKHRRDAFCGKLSVCANLYQYFIPFTDTTEHTCRIDSPEFIHDLDRFARICRTVNGLSHARIGAIGARPAAFQTVRFSEKILQASGITVIPVDMSVIIAAAESIKKDDSDVKSMLDQIKSYGAIPDYIKEENIVKQASLSVVINRWMEENECDASAIQCWDSIQKNYGCATCLTMAMMGEKFMPSACEVDVVGAISMYALLLASGNVPGFLDWNNNYADQRDKCINTHCSNYPKSFVGGDIEISNLDILGESLGADRCFGAIKAKVAPGDMTFFRISTDDTAGGITSYVGEGEFTDDPCDIDGGAAVCKIDNLRQLMGFMAQNGFEHHVAMTRSHCADVLYEAVTKYLGWESYYHNVM